jgi:nitrogen fixation protein FixH
MIARGWRMFNRVMSVFFGVVAAVCLVLWLVGSSHAGHFLNADELEAFELEAGRWLAKGWR